jgi:hypothetical protein
LGVVGGDKGNVLVREEGVSTALEHHARKVAHDGLSLDGQVPKHLVRAPAPKEADGVGVDVGAQEGHGARGAEGAGADVRLEETEGGTEGADRRLESDGYVGGRDKMWATGHVVGTEGSGGRGIVVAKVENSARSGGHRACVGVAAAPEADDFVSDCVLLSGEREGNEGGTEQHVGRSREGGATLQSNVELDIFQFEGCVFAARGGVFAGAEQEEESEGDEVSDGERIGRSMLIGECHHVVDDVDWDWLDALRRRVKLGVGSQLSAEAELGAASGS